MVSVGSNGYGHYSKKNVKCSKFNQVEITEIDCQMRETFK